jgi:UDP-glucose 4-epimerase
VAKCLILGGNGFIGSHLVDVLAEQGHTLRCFDRYKTDDVIYRNDDHHVIELFRGDFLSRASIEEALEGIDYVFHFVSTTTPLTAENDPIVDIETNIKMSVELFQLCAEKNVKKVIFASTGGAIYGETGLEAPINEDVYPKPISPYAIGKLTIENYLRYFKRKFKLPYVVYRISNPYGPRQNTMSGQGVIPIFLEKIANGEPIMLYGDGSMVRDYIYVEDVGQMIAGSFEGNGKQDVYNLASGTGYTVNDIVGAISTVTGRDVKMEHKETPSTFVQSVRLDAAALKRDFGVSAHTSLEEGIRKTWEALQKHKKQ